MRLLLQILITFVVWMPLAAAESPVGHWHTINEETGKTEALVEIWQDVDQLFGKIVELLDPEEPNPLCTLCDGERKDQPVTGMTIIWDLERKGDSWEGGYILDPNNGQAYNSIIKVNDQGQLEVRGFVGFALLGRTQIWHRAE